MIFSLQLIWQSIVSDRIGWRNEHAHMKGKWRKGKRIEAEGIRSSWIKPDTQLEQMGKKEQKNWMTTCKTQMAGERKRRSVMLVAPPVSLFLWHNHLVTLACRPRENDKDSETKVDVFTYTRKNGFISQADGLFFPSSGHVKRTRRWVKRDWRGEQRAKWQQGADDEWVIRDREERRRWNQSGTVVIATAASALLPLCATSYFLLLLLLLPPVPSS